MYLTNNLENKISESIGSYELQKGVCSPDETIRMQIQIEKNDNGTYQDKQVKVIIFMASLNGNIPAGSISLVLNPTCTSEQPIVISIQKCPDKSATLSYTHTLEFLRVVPKSNSQTKTHSTHRRMEESGIINSSRGRVGNGSPSYNTLKNSQKLTSSHGRGSTNKNGNSTSASLYQINRELSDQDFQDKKDRTSKFFEETSEGSVRKRIDIQKQKTEKMKQTTLLIRQSIKKHREQRNNTDQVDSVRLKQQVSQISNENKSLREKIKNLERKEKEQSERIKQLSQEMERKGDSQQLIKSEGKNCLQQKQSIIKQYQIQIKQFQEQITTLKINISTQNKRIQLKQVSFKDQLNRIQQKYHQSQVQRQRSVVEHNKMLEQLQSREKKNQLNSKQKDRVHGEQKSKLNKKLESLQRIIEQQKETIEENKSTSQQQISNIKKTKQELESKFSQSQQASHQITSLSQQIADLNLLNLELEQKLSKQQQVLADTNSRLSIIREQKQEQALKLKQVEFSVEQKSRQIWELNEKCREISESLFIYEQKYKDTSDTIQSQETDILNKQDKLNQMAQTINQLQFQILANVQTINQLNHQNDNLKHQFNTTKKQNAHILLAKNQLEDQYREISNKYTSLAAQLDNEKTSNNESVVSFTSIHKQFEKYRRENSHALKVLMQEISKQYNPKILETTLGNFPDQAMNSLQTLAIQKRNILFKKYYEQIMSLTQNLKSLQNQLADQKEQSTQQKQNLEDLLQEQKSKLKSIQLEKQQMSDKIGKLEHKVNELSSQNKEKNIKIEENESKIMGYQGLVSELQLEVSHCKNEIKAFENDFKLQQEENLRTKSNFQNVFYTANQQSLAQIQRLRKTISENDLEILKINELQISVCQVNKKLQQALIENKKMEEMLALKQYENKKLVGDIEILNEQIVSLSYLMKESADKNKRHVEKSAQDMKKLKQQVIALNSQMSLKQMEMSQNQNIIKSLKIANQGLTQQANQKKVELSEFSLKLQQNKNRMILLAQQLQALKVSNGNYEQEKRLMKESMINLEMAVDENKANFQLLGLKDRQIGRIKEENSIKEKSYERITQDLKSQVVQYKKQIMARTQRQEEHKKKAKELETVLKTQLYDLQKEHKTWEENAEKEKIKLLYDLKGAKEENKLLSQQFQNQRQQINTQLDQAVTQNCQLRQTLNRNQIEANNSSQRVTSLLEKVKSLQQQLDNCKEQWLKEKGQYKPTKTHLKQAEDQIFRYQKYVVQLQKKNKQLTELVKRRLAEEPQSSCGDILREVNTILLRNKAKILNKCGERQRQQVVADFKQIHEKLQGAMKSYHEMK